MALTPKSVNTQQASELLGIPTRSVRRLIENGQLGAVRLGRYLVIPIEEIDRLLAPARRGDI
ncbi:excisionase family DNA binding protein [Kibdelosporangium banguiense]|uniref:Excisionase family DNA binding protein n=1 Tax=Kibdelosporangium banguiense TaxID=1365924 RepID=A0ABS4TC07_9PSEU|nr:helix-turn-helix domain-containing protein [Kibdelosporangium banguiense]MBP2321386.1 excisionase family DNA binding protein [Kibdelosporangium banguiense]